MKRVLVVSPHPDDESIGCGGTLRLHARDGDEVRIVFLTSGEAGGFDVISPQELALQREQEAAEAARILGVEEIEFWHQPDSMLRVNNALVRRLAQTLRTWNPDVVYAPHAHEDSPDHRAGCRLVRRAVASLDGEGARPDCRFFEVWTPIRRIDEIVDISETLDDKLEAIRAHRSQCDIMRFDDAARGLARYRGEMHLWPGGDYAEVFSR